MANCNKTTQVECPSYEDSLYERVADLEATTVLQAKQIEALTERTDYLWCKLSEVIETSLPELKEVTDLFLECGLVGDCSASGSASIS